MAGATNKPYGLKPLRYLNGTPWNGAVTQYIVDGATDLFVGDAVVLTGTSGAAGLTVSGIDCQGMPYVTAAAAAVTLLGVCVGIIPTQATDGLYHASGTHIALVVDDPFVVFRIQEDGDTSSLVVGDIGENADIVATTGDTTTGVSKHVLDSSDHKTATAQLRILRLARSDSGTVNNISTAGAAGNYADFEVLINEHMFNQAVGI